MNSDISHDSDCVFYDSELKRLRSAFADADKILKGIAKRAERRQTVQISKSLFDYVESSKELRVAPQKFYDFRFGDVRICPFVYKSRFSVLVVGYSLDSPETLVRDYQGAGELHYRFDSLDVCLETFRYIVECFVSEVVFKGVLRDNGMFSTVL